MRDYHLTHRVIWMLSLRSVSPQKLTALRFNDDVSFRKAARVAAEAHIPVDAPGHRTLVVQLEHVGLFERANIAFQRELIADVEKVAPKEYGALRKRLFGMPAK